jgi:hypothetical protein
MSKDKKEVTLPPSGAVNIIKETFLHPLQESVIDNKSGKVVERGGAKVKEE